MVMILKTTLQFFKLRKTQENLLIPSR